MARRFAAFLIAGIAVIAIVAMTHRPSHAALATGKIAPLFTTEAAAAGNVFTFDLAKALEKGPVVLYFYPAAFTSGCTVEAHDFAENVPEFKKLGATVIGVSGDGIEKLQRFSSDSKACSGKFAVASDKNLAIAKQYDAVLMNAYANRTSFVIATDGTIAYEYTALDPDKHVSNTLAALKKLKAKP